LKGEECNNMGRKNERGREYTSCGDLEHPANYDSAAYLTEAQFKQLLQKYTEQQQLIKQYSEAKKDGFIVYYGKLMMETESGAILRNRQ
jgi:hypothetical protein